MSAHDCTQQGHVWREGVAVESDWNDNGDYIGTAPTYARRRGSSPDTVDVFCQYCTGTRQLPRASAFSGARAPGQPVQTDIPPQFLAVVARALATAAATTTGPVPKTP